MRTPRILQHRLRSLLRRRSAESDLHRELALHLEQLASEYRAAGLSEADALAAARRDFGPVGLTEEQCRDTRRVGFVEDLLRDLSYAVRALRQSPVFSLAAIVSLALGIGANTAIYSFVDAILLRALPIPEPQNLVVVNWRAKGNPKVVRSSHGDGYQTPEGNSVAGIFPYPAWEQLRDHTPALSTLFAFAEASRFNLVINNQASLGDGEYVSGNYFSGIGLAPSAGRLFRPGDDRPGAPDLAVISDRLWERAWQRSPAAVGQTILVDRHPYTVTGITPPGFFGLNPRESPDVFLPLHTIAVLDPRLHSADWFHQDTTYWLQIVGRLRPGATLQSAEVAMAGQFHAFAAASATRPGEKSNLPALWLQEGGSGIDSLRRQYSRPLFVLLVMTGLILAIACANIANLLLARATKRRREFAIRLSLGAGRLRIVRQLLTESVLTALLGGALGLAVAQAGIRFLTWLLSGGSSDPRLHAHLDLRVLAVTLAISMLTGMLFGLAPALQATRVDVLPALKDAAASVAARRRRIGLPFGLSHVLVSGQIALSLLLLVAAGLFITTLHNLHSVALGFNPEQLLTFSVNAQQAGYSPERAAGLYENLRQSFSAIPGVESATTTSNLLASGSSDSSGIEFPGRPRDHKTGTSLVFAGPDFFATLQIPMLRGRPINNHDLANTPRIAVVNQRFADMYFPGQNCLAQHFTFPNEKPIDIQIVGVARNTRYANITKEIPPVAYLAWSQPLPFWIVRDMFFELRTRNNPLTLANTVRQIVHQANPQLPVADLATHRQFTDSTIAPERTFAHLCACFAALALLIAAVGLYGTMSYTVARRTNEIGIRMALGAQRPAVIWMVLREVAAMSLAGLAAGLTVAWFSARLVASFLYGVRPGDAQVYLTAGTVLVFCALLAGWTPAWRASQIDPMQALRHD